VVYQESDGKNIGMHFFEDLERVQRMGWEWRGIMGLLSETKTQTAYFLTLCIFFASSGLKIICFWVHRQFRKIRCVINNLSSITWISIVSILTEAVR
jgi:hypothetical protein